MEIWTLNQLGEIDKPAGLLDVSGYYQPFLAFIDHMIGQRFLPPEHRNGIVVQPEPGLLIDGLMSFRKVTVPKWM
jgi:predicted Rossmann-fold nucleotide-binding protein